MNKKTLLICLLIAVMLLISTFIFPQYTTVLGIIAVIFTGGTVGLLMLKYIRMYYKTKEEYFNKIETLKKEEKLTKTSEND